MRRFSRFLACSLAVLPIPCAAQNTLDVNVGGDLNLMDIAMNIMFFLVALIPIVAVAMFMVGALMLVLAHGKEDQVDNAKKLLLGSVIGMAVVLGSYGIVRTVYWFLFA